MKYIIAGTNRPQSRTLEVSKYIQSLYRNMGEEVEIIDLAQLPFTELTGMHYGQELPQAFKEVSQKIVASDGLIMVVPEYNGSFPGILKYFIDYWKYPEAFENRPICFVGLGGLFGGLRPIEHLQQVFSYRNAFLFPNRVFIMNVFKVLQNGQVVDENIQKLLQQQADQFRHFVQALQSQKLDAVSRLQKNHKG